MNGHDQPHCNWTHLVAVAYCTAAYSIVALTLYAYGIRTPLKMYPGTQLAHELFYLIAPLSAGLLLLGAFLDGFSIRLHRSTPFRLAAIAMFFTFFAAIQ